MPALAEAAVWERVGSDPMSLLDTAEGGARLAAIYTEYCGAAKRWGLPMLLFAPTWRANRNRSEPGANARAVEFVRRFSPFTGALMGPRNDCYDPAAALSREEAAEFHRWQAAELACADFVLAATMPAVSEALGIADVLTVPCVLSFVITARGELLDGTPLDDAISRIDASAARRPAGYWINCVHPRTVIEGLSAIRRREVIRRILGVQANTSPLDPRTFSTAADFSGDSPPAFARAMLEIHEAFSIPILGGCCGTRTEHLEEIASLLRHPRA